MATIQEVAPEAPVEAAPKAASNTAAAAALAHAAQTGFAASAPQGHPPVGQPLSHATSVYDIESKRSEEMLPQLEVQPITYINTDFNLSLGHQVRTNLRLTRSLPVFLAAWPVAGIRFTALSVATTGLNFDHCNR